MERIVVCQELASLLTVLSHPDRVRIVVELGYAEQNVSSLTTILSLSSSRVSQHLTLLRAHRLVIERRDGRRHFYSLSNPELASWILGGLQFLESEQPGLEKIHSAVDKVRAIWRKPGSAKTDSDA